MSTKELTPSGELVTVHEISPILKLVVSGIQVTGSKHFIADKTSLDDANVVWMGDNFDQFFLGKVEEDVKDATVAIFRLEKRSVDTPIRKELIQKREREEITLTHFFDLLKKQSKGEKGHLLVNGYANIAYIRGTDGNLRAVGACWNLGCGCWGVDAFSIEDPNSWDVGDQIVSCDLS